MAEPEKLLRLELSTNEAIYLRHALGLAMQSVRRALQKEVNVDIVRARQSEVETLQKVLDKAR